MDSSRRAVESYWRSRMIDAATSDEDKVTPVYKLEEICDLLRSSHASIVKELSEFVLKRLDHKSPIVKQKALRLIKYAVGKSGAEFRREIQRHSVAVRQLIHYRGHPDPLKGDSLNKAVRETAQGALSAIFSNEENKPAPADDNIRGRIEGFGNTNYAPPMDEKKSFISEVVDIGSASIKQGISNLTQGHYQKSNHSGNHGSYKGPTLRRSLTNEIDYTDKYESMEHNGGKLGSYGSSSNLTTGPWGQDSRPKVDEMTNGGSSSSTTHSEIKTREERLLETIVTSGGVRLQPTRDALQAFLLEALKMDAVSLSIALESKLQSPLWQVRMKAVCVLEAILRKGDEHFSVVETFFTENMDTLVQCSESPQGSLREKASKVLNLLGGAQAGSASTHSEKLTKAEPAEKIEMPDLIDTGDADDLLKSDDLLETLNDQKAVQQPTPAPFIDDLFGGDLINDGATTVEQKSNDDPFSDVSFHSTEDKELGSDLFAGMTVGNDATSGVDVPKTTVSDPFDFFSSGSEPPHKQEDSNSNGLDNLMAGLSIATNGSVNNNNTGFSGDIGIATTQNGQSQASQNSNGGLDLGSMTANAALPTGSIPYNMAPGFMYNQSFPSQPFNYGAMGGFLSQQQLVAAMVNLQQLQQMGGVNNQNPGVSFSSEPDVGALPDIFNATVPNQSTTMLMNNAKKEDTKAFDFITDHMAAARDTKRLI